MKLVRHTIRLPEALDKTLRVLAERHGISVYALLPRAVKAGVAALANPPAPDTLPREIVAELASVSTRIVDVERMLDRALFTACAAYCYARSAALGARTNDETVTAEINAAYDRQRRLSQEKRP
jgi:plasmid stability protein